MKEIETFFANPYPYEKDYKSIILVCHKCGKETHVKVDDLKNIGINDSISCACGEPLVRSLDSHKEDDSKPSSPFIESNPYRKFNHERKMEEQSKQIRLNADNYQTDFERDLTEFVINKIKSIKEREMTNAEVTNEHTSDKVPCENLTDYKPEVDEQKEVENLNPQFAYGDELIDKSFDSLFDALKKEMNTNDIFKRHSILRMATRDFDMMISQFYFKLLQDAYNMCGSKPCCKTSQKEG